MDIIKQLKWRYATKKFDPTKKLSKNKIQILKEAFNLTATSFGLQTITMVVVEDRDIRKPLVGHSYNQNQVADASHLLVICVQNNIEDLDVNSYYQNIKDIRLTADEILEPYRKSLVNFIGDKTIEERQRWSLNQAYIALGNLMTVCAIEEIDSCPMEGFVPDAYDKHLGLDTINLKSVLLLPVGYRAQDDIFAGFKKVRKNVEESTIDI